MSALSSLALFHQDERERARDAGASELLIPRLAKKPREAERRKTQRPDVRAFGRGSAPCEARPPCGAPPRHSPPAVTPMAQLQNRVSGDTARTGVLPASARPLAVSSSRTGHSAGRAGPRSRPGAECKSARGHRASLRLPGLPSGKAPSVSKVTMHVTQTETVVKAWSPIQRPTINNGVVARSAFILPREARKGDRAAQHVARIERSEIRDSLSAWCTVEGILRPVGRRFRHNRASFGSRSADPDFASLNPGYDATMLWRRRRPRCRCGSAEPLSSNRI